MRLKPWMRIAALLMILVMVAVACDQPSYRKSKKSKAFRDSGPFIGPGEEAPTVPVQESPGVAGGKRSAGTSSTGAGATVPGEDTVLGVGDKHIEVVYYWKGDQTRTSPFLQGTGVESNVDEGAGFRTWIEYINKHSEGGGTVMGFPFNLHGRKLVGRVIEVGSDPEDVTAAAEHISTELKPFAAIAAHGSLSTYTCPRLAKAGVFSLATFNVDFGLYGKTRGYCIPSAASFDAQFDAVTGYLTTRMAPTLYEAATGRQPRKFGLVYAEYPGLVDAVPSIVDKLEKSGIRFAETQSLSANLSQAQSQAPGVVAKFQDRGINTVIIPDAGAPMSFTPAAEAHGYRPDYLVWPCSGQDSPAMIRLYNANQWGRASGLTCYDPDFMNDLTIDGPARSTEWYAKYMSMNRGEPPAQAPYIYASLLPLLAGITNAGPALNPRTFKAGLDKFSPYRYTAGAGKAATPENMLLTLDGAERSVLGDFTILRWSNTTHRPGANLAGAYVFPENGRRYGRDELR